MTDKDYLAEFLDQEQLGEGQETTITPNWVNPTNSSKKAYEAILSLREMKKKYIQRHNTFSKFTKKSNYLITKVEVARIVGVNPQPLFNNVGYAKQLSHFLDEVNSNLEGTKSGKLSRSKGGLRQKRKEELVKDLQSEKKNSEDLLKELVDAVYQRTLDNLPLDVRKKLNLDC